MKALTHILVTFLLLQVISFPVLSNDEQDLFADATPLNVIIEMDMDKVLNDASADPEYLPAAFRYKVSDKRIQSFDIKIKVRGRTRRKKSVCEFPPLKLNFKKKAVVNTLFEGQDKISMVTHCQDDPDFQNYCLLEYLTYKTYNLLTPYSYKVRRVNITYRDTKETYSDIENIGFLIEDDELLEKRIGATITDKRIWSADSCSQETVGILSLFQFMIGNTDWWIHTRHNVDIFELENQALIPVPFDFDYAGIINIPYAVPSPQLPISKVKDRFFKGSCKSAEHYEDAIKVFNSKKEEIQQLLERTDELSSKSKRMASKYIDSFYSIINDTSKFESYLVATCELENKPLPGLARTGQD